jgi:hypothetical protein
MSEELNKEIRAISISDGNEYYEVGKCGITKIVKTS